MAEKSIGISAAQCRAARGLLGWTQYDLAERAGIGVLTIHQLEAGISRPRRATLRVVVQAFAAAGVQLIEESDGAGEGVRFQNSQRRFPK
jgi:transcriptional regulator with XRE-family HTH domain